MAAVPPGLSSATLPPVDSPGTDPLKIGPVTFNSIECPSKLPIGALEHVIVEKQLVGGGKDTQSLGVQPKDVQWSGTLFQPNVDNRVAALQAMARDGKEYPLTWRSHRYFCKVKNVTPGFRNANVCEYDITVVITRAGNGALFVASPVGIDAQVSVLSSGISQQNSVITAADPTGSQSFQQTLTTLQAAIIAAGPLAQLTGPATSSLLQNIADALSSVQAYQQNLTDGTPQAVAAAQLFSSLLLLQKNITRGQTQNTQRVQGASFFDVATLVYEDVSLAFTLMQANGAISPFTSRQKAIDITLPPLQNSAS